MIIEESNIPEMRKRLRKEYKQALKEYEVKAKRYRDNESYPGEHADDSFSGRPEEPKEGKICDCGYIYWTNREYNSHRWKSHKFQKADFTEYMFDD